MFGLSKLKDKLISQVVQKLTGSWIRGGMRVLSGFLLSIGVADVDTAAEFSGSLGEIIVNTINLVATDPNLFWGTLTGSVAQWWSVKEKKGKVGD